MTRSEAKTALEKLGIAEVTEEQITNFLNSLNSEVSKYKGKADRTDELETKLAEIENAKLSDLEKSQKETETALARIKELEAKIKTSELKANLANAGITGEHADKLIASLEGGGIDVSVLSEIIAIREKASADAKEKEIAGNADNPGGGGGKDHEEKEKTESEKFVSERAKATSEANKASADIVSQYL